MTGALGLVVLGGGALSLLPARGVRGGLALLAFYLPQLAVLVWMARDLRAGGLGLWSEVVLVVALALLVVHRVTTYALPVRPSRWDLPWFSLVHTTQTALLAACLIWPLTRLLPLGPGADPALAAGLVVLSAAALLTTHLAPRRVDVAVEVAGLTRPVRIVQVSDLHVGPYMDRARLRALAMRIRAIEPDLIALTGDLFTLRSEQDPRPLWDFYAALPEAPLGRFVCMGNHDLRCRDALRLEGERHGVRLLEDSHVDVGELRIIGLDWHGWGEKRAYAEVLAGLLAAGRPHLVLCHDPAPFSGLPPFSGLMLSGHLHGGQVGLRWRGSSYSPLRLLGTVAQGLHRRGAAQLYVHRGTGTYGLPVRLGIPQELAVLEVRPAAGSASSGRS